MEGREKAFPHPLSHSGGIWILQLSLIGEGMRKTVPQLTGKENEKQGAKVNALTLVCCFHILQIFVVGKTMNV